MTAYRSLLYLIVEAGLFALYIPLAFLRSGPQIETGVISFLAVPLWLIGALIVLWCFWDFTFKGRGTPIPTDPPKELVVTGMYRFVRNPIYVGVYQFSWDIFCGLVIGHYCSTQSWRFSALIFSLSSMKNPH